MTPASAEVGVTASLFSDARLRGYSLSERQPVALLDFAYDHSSGLYLGGSASAVLRRGGDPAPFALQLDGGYSKRLSSGTTIDFGITHSSYAHYSASERGTSYSEVYAGIAHGALSSRIFLSPHYFQRGRWTAYGELNGALSPARNWALNAHAGVLVPLRTPERERYRPDLDWSLGVTRELGRLALHAAWSDGSPRNDFYNKRQHSRNALVVGAGWAL